MPDIPKNGSEENSQKILVTARARIEISGVKGVVAFDEGEIVLESETGRISVEGEGLRITVLSLENGVVEAQGKINAVVCQTEKGEKRSGLFGRRG